MLCHVMLCYVVLRVVLQYACTYVQRQWYGSILRLHIAYLCGVLPLVQDLLPYHSLVWFFPTQLLDCMGFSIFSRNGLCSLMICWLLLVPAGVPVLVSLLLSSFRTKVLFHHDLLVPPGSGWGSGACLPSSLFFLASGKGFCSIMICWFLLVPAGVSVLVSLLLSSLVPVLVSLLLSSFFPQERGSVPSWFAGSSWFRLGFRCLSPFFSLLWFRCLSPFFSLLSFLRKGVLFHHDLLAPPGSGWGSSACLPSSLFFGSGACLPSSLFFLSSGQGFCYIMICWFLLVPAGVPVLVSLLLSFFLPQDRGSVPSWFAGSSWFRLGFRCLSPFLSLLSFLRKGVLFHHDLLVPLGSGWGSGACLPSSPFFLSAGKGFCSIMICWFFLVPAGVPVLVSFILSSLVPVLVSFLVSSFFPQERGSVPSWFAGSSWFRLGFLCLSPLFSLLSFRCLSPFLSLLSFLRKGVLFHHDLLVPPGSGWGSGACLLSSLFFLSSGKGFCSFMICWFLLVPAGVSVLVSLLLFSFFRRGFCSIMICWFLLVPAGVSVLVSLLLSSLVPLPFSLLLSSFFPQERDSVPSWFAGSSWFRLGFLWLSPLFSLLWFRCFSPFLSLLSFLRTRVLFHHDLLVPPGSGWGSGACLPSSLFFGSGACLPSLFFLSSGKGFCSIMVCWFLVVPAGVPVLFFLLLSSLVPLLSPFFSLLSFLCSIMVPAGVPISSVLFHHDSGRGFGACLPSSLFFPLVPVLVSLLLSSFFPRERGSVPSWFAGSGWGSGACLPSSLFFL